MKKNIILLALLFTASAIFISCDRNDDDPTPQIVLTSPDAVRVYADQTTATNAVNFNATGAWTATVSYPPTTTASVRSTTPTWITIDRSSGNAGSNQIINITFTEINFSGEDRIAIITIRSGDTEIVITVTQRGVDANNNIPQPEPGADVIIATNVLGNTAEIATAKAVVRDWINDDWEVFAQSPFQNRSFRLELPTPPNNFLRPLWGEGVPTGLYQSVHPIKVANVAFRAFSSTDTENTIGVFEFTDYPDIDEMPTILNTAHWLYVDRDVTITGTIQGGGGGWYTIDKYNLNLRRGWNIVYERYTKTVVDYTVTQTVTTTSQRPADATNLSWRFIGVETVYPVDPYSRSATSVERQSIFLRGR